MPDAEVKSLNLSGAEQPKLFEILQHGKVAVGEQLTEHLGIEGSPRAMHDYLQISWGWPRHRWESDP